MILRAIIPYLLPIFILYQAVFGNEGSKWINSSFSEIENAANSGDIYAKGFLALCFLHGDKGLSVNHTEARFFAESASSLDHWLGNFVLGYLSGMAPLGPDDKKVAKYYSKVFRDPNGDIIKYAAANDPIAQYVLAEIFTSEQLSPILESDLSLALKYYELSANHGYAPAILQCALIKIYGMVNDLVENTATVKEGIRQLKLAVDSDLPSAHHYLGRCNIEGLGVSTDLSMALIHLQASADRGYGPSQLIVADFYAYGHGCPVNLEKALSYAQLAYDNYQSGADKKMEEIEKMLMPNNTGPANEPKNNSDPILLSSLKKPSNLVDIQSFLPDGPREEFIQNQSDSFRLSSAYSSQEDLSEKSTLDKPASSPTPKSNVANDDSSSGSNSSKICEEAKRLYWGTQGDKGLQKAVELFSVSADLGDAEAARYLGIMYLKGKGVNRDSKKAIEWLELASSRGDTLAQKNLEALRKILKM